MTKKEKEKEIQYNLYIFEHPEEYPELNNRIDAMKKVILDTRNYLKDYKVPFKYKFMGTNISFNNTLIEELEDLNLQIQEKFLEQI